VHVFSERAQDGERHCLSLHAYSYVIVELLFSDDYDIVWTFLGEINFLIGRGAPDSIQVQLAVTTTTFSMGVVHTQYIRRGFHGEKGYSNASQH